MSESWSIPPAPLLCPPAQVVARSLSRRLKISSLLSVKVVLREPLLVLLPTSENIEDEDSIDYITEGFTPGSLPDTKKPWTSIFLTKFDLESGPRDLEME